MILNVAKKGSHFSVSTVNRTKVTLMLKAMWDAL